MIVRSCLLLCLVAIVAGPLYTEPGYNVIAHSVSELAGQATANAWIMRLGLLALGIAGIQGFMRAPNRLNASFLAFGLCMIGTALFPHKPFIPDRPYSVLLDDIHSWFASLGGLAAVLGFVMLGINTPAIPKRILYLAVAAGYTGLPVLMFVLPAFQGVFQRLLFGSFILWAFIEYPRPLEKQR